MHLKKSALLFLAFFALNALHQKALAQTAPSFSDAENTWAADCIQNLATNQVINGYGDRTFRPNAQVSRGEFAAMLQKAFPGAPRRSSPIFQDMQGGHWATNAVRAAAGQGFLSGYPDGQFRPNAPIQRLDMDAG